MEGEHISEEESNTGIGPGHQFPVGQDDCSERLADLGVLKSLQALPSIFVWRVEPVVLTLLRRSSGKRTHEASQHSAVGPKNLELYQGQAWTCSLQ